MLVIPDNIPIELLETPIRLIDVLVKFGFADSNTQAKNLIKQEGISIDGEKVRDINLVIEKLDFPGIFISKSRRKMVCFQPFMGDPLWDTKEENGEFAVDNLSRRIEAEERSKNQNE